MSAYLVVVEGDGQTNYSAYCPDLPGVVATGSTVEECAAEMADAIAFHIESLRNHGESVPEPTSRAVTVEVAA
ncbi:MAG: type II toxin-antitoxin system HicB family antitoxin [Pseudonocardia sp.]